MKTQQPYNYNNYDYNDNNNDYYNTIIIARSGVANTNDHADSCFAPELAEPTSDIVLPEGSGGSHIETLPQIWTYAKVTLFDNAAVEEIQQGKRKLKLALSVKSAKDGKFKQFTASMNSPFRHLKRGLSSEDFANSHYSLVTELYQNAKQSSDNVFVSKFHITGDRVKGRTVTRLSALLVQLPKDGQYLALVIVGDDVVYFTINGKTLTQKQKKQGAIAQGFISSGVVKSPDITDIF